METVELCKGESVPELMWQIIADDENTLDRYEGWLYI